MKQTSIIKEPEGVIFLVEHKRLSQEDKDLITEFIEKDKSKKRTLSRPFKTLRKYSHHSLSVAIK
ncbi:MAG: hypothetical protein KGZ58_11945 [Ignavibacteriales bacterium]|nr:hypothetical protein [Ignavibacteriales bacterium]